MELARPRTYVESTVVERAKETFWEKGYEATAMGDLEARTGLSRSSLYLAFGAKRSLFEIALDRYFDSFIDPLLEPMEQSPGGTKGVLIFFSRVKDVLLGELPTAQRGCLMVNTIAELAGRDEDATGRAISFRDRLRRAFAQSLGGQDVSPRMRSDVIRRRSSMLATATLGIWISARSDPVDAAVLCDEIAAEVASWPSSPARVRR